MIEALSLGLHKTIVHGRGLLKEPGSYQMPKETNFRNTTIRVIFMDIETLAMNLTHE